MTLAVVHLVRRQNGPQPLREFVEAYAAHSAGVDHDLVLAMKGFPDPDVAREALDLARPFRPDVLFLPDDGFDVMAYFRAAERLSHERVCLVNSFSRPLVDGWLAKLADALENQHVALAGATGSWASQLDYLRYQVHLPSAYTDVFEDRGPTRLAFEELAREHDPAIGKHGRLATTLLTAAALARQTRTFDGFPTPHVRTNALMLRRELLLTAWPREVSRKVDAYRFESGRGSLTARVMELGLRAVVVGRDAAVYDVDNWPESETLWQGAQHNLLVADNRTDDYQRGNADRRLLLARFAWGMHAAPA